MERTHHIWTKEGFKRATVTFMDNGKARVVSEDGKHKKTMPADKALARIDAGRPINFG